MLSIQPPASAAGVRCKVVSFTIDMATASGTQSVTGVGFRPKGVIFLGGTNQDKNMGIGVDDGTTRGCIYDDHNDLANTYGVTTFGIGAVNAAAKGYFGSVQSFDADGFTMVWTRQSTPTGIETVKALCIG